MISYRLEKTLELIPGYTCPGIFYLRSVNCLTITRAGPLIGRPSPPLQTINTVARRYPPEPRVAPAARLTSAEYLQTQLTGVLA